MIVIDQDSQVSEWLRSLEFEEIGFARIDLMTFEVANGLESELIIIQDTVYHQLSPLLVDKLKSVSGVIVFNSTKQDLQFVLDNIVGVISTDISPQIIKNQITFFEDSVKRNEILKSQLISLNKELKETMEGVGTQLLRVKKVYEQKAPKRLENFKGFTIYSKYAAGEDMGGEFFDIFAKENKIFMLMSASSSYIASSSILEYFSELKSYPEISENHELEFVEKIKEELDEINKNKKKPVEAQIITCILDVNSLEINGHIFGNFQVVSSNLKREVKRNSSIAGNIENAKFTIKLERGERILLNSPGFINNWDMSKPAFLIEELVSDNNIKALDVLDEVYFQLKKESQSGFLTHDASSLILEVQKNVMLKV